MCCFEHEWRTTFRKRIKFGHGVETDNMQFTWGMGAPQDRCRNNIIIQSTVLVNQCWNHPSLLFKLYLWKHCLHSENIPLIFSPSNFCWLTWANFFLELTAEMLVFSYLKFALILLYVLYKALRWFDLMCFRGHIWPWRLAVKAMLSCRQVILVYK